MVTSIAVRTRVALFDDMPDFRMSLRIACSNAGLMLDQVENVGEWVGCQDAAVVVTLDRPDRWAVLRTIRRSSSEIVIFALLLHCDVSACYAALEAGATVVAARDSEPEHLVTTLLAALKGQIVLPAALVEAFVDQFRTRHADRAAVLSELDIELLRMLKRGETVTAMAQRLHMASRTVDRRLQNLYRRMGVRTRLQAVAWAVHWRVLDPWT